MSLPKSRNNWQKSGLDAFSHIQTDWGREKTLAAVKVSKEDIDLLVCAATIVAVGWLIFQVLELEISPLAAEQALKENGGDAVATMSKFVH